MTTRFDPCSTAFWQKLSERLSEMSRDAAFIEQALDQNPSDQLGKPIAQPIKDIQKLDALRQGLADLSLLFDRLSDQQDPHEIHRYLTLEKTRALIANTEAELEMVSGDVDLF